MLNIFKFILKPLKTEYLMILFAMKTVVMIFSICWLMAVANAAATQQQPQSLIYKQQLQYQMQQHDKFEYQQHMKQQQQFYQQQYHQQQAPTSMALLQEQQQQEQQQKLRLQQQEQQYLMKPSQMLQTTASFADIHSEVLLKLSFKQIPPNFKVAKGKEVNNLKEKLKLIAKPTTKKSTTRDVNTSTTTMISGGATYRFSTSTTTPSTTTPTSTSTTTTTESPSLMTTINITSKTTSSTTMNLTQKANLDLNTDEIRERIQKNLHKNPLERKGYFLRSEGNDNEKDSDLSEETIKSTEYYETSTITNEMKQHNTPSISYKSSTFTLPSTPNPSTDNLNILPSFDIVDDAIDFMELIEDDKSGKRLYKLLENNNITLEELIEHRRPGSSQLHLSTIVESSPRFDPDEKSALQDNMDIVTVIENLPHFSLFNLKNGKPYNIKNDDEVNNYFDSTIDIENTDEV